MKVTNLEKVVDGVVQNWHMEADYNGRAVQLVVYVKSSDNKMIGWHSTVEVKDKDIEEVENYLQEYVNNNEVKSPAVEFFEKLLEHNAGRSICNVAVENGDKETFDKYFHMVKGEKLDDNL